MDVDHPTEFNTSADNWGNLQAHSLSLVSGSAYMAGSLGNTLLLSAFLLRRDGKVHNL